MGVAASTHGIDYSNTVRLPINLKTEAAWPDDPTPLLARAGEVME